MYYDVCYKGRTAPFAILVTNLNNHILEKKNNLGNILILLNVFFTASIHQQINCNGFHELPW